MPMTPTFRVGGHRLVHRRRQRRLWRRHRLHSACSQPSGYVLNDTDCDDTDTAINPDAAEVCDSIDNDCNTLVDDDDPALDLGTATTFYSDVDGDTYGDLPVAPLRCSSGYVTDDSDCDDDDINVNPAATEVCDGVDNIDTNIDDDAPRYQHPDRGLCRHRRRYLRRQRRASRARPSGFLHRRHRLR